MKLILLALLVLASVSLWRAESIAHPGLKSISILAMKDNKATTKSLPTCAATQVTAAASGPGVGAGTAKKKQSTFRRMLPILASAFCAAAIMYPLDLVRALQMANAGSGLTTGQLLANFRKDHGVIGFFTQGLVPELARSTWMRFIKFALFPLVHEGLFHVAESKGNEKTKAIAAIISSIPEAISIMPLELSKLALQLDSKKIYSNNMFLAMADLYRTYGFRIFSVGYLGIQYRQAAWSAGYFASIKFFEKQVSSLFAALNLSPAASPVLLSVAQLLSGFLGGVFGASLNTPGDTVRSTLQKKVLQGGRIAGAGLSLAEVGGDIVQKKGLSGLYAGFGFKAMHLGGGGALMAFLVPFFTKVFEEK